jgi:hypothetical protein
MIGCRCGDCSLVGVARDWWFWNVGIRWYSYRDYERRKASKAKMSWFRYWILGKRTPQSLHPIEWYCE